MVDKHSTPVRKPLSVRTRFEIFKRDDFTCKYCGRKSPEVVLEVDHIVPVCEGGDDDPINLITSCWECNAGKAGVPLANVLTAEDPHERAIYLLERERQLREYNAILAEIRERRENDCDNLIDFWCHMRGDDTYWKHERAWLMNELERTAPETIRRAMNIAVAYEKTKNMRYVAGILRAWRENGEQ